MHRKKVACIGAPMVGKTALLARLATLTSASQLKSEATEVARFIHLHVAHTRHSLHVVTIQGPFLDRARVLETVLSNADVVLYVVAASPKAGQEQDFSDFVTYARAVQVTWDDVPWVFVLNKADVSDQSPMLAHIPDRLRETMVRCSAVTGDGVQQVWDRIVSLCA